MRMGRAIAHLRYDLKPTTVNPKCHNSRTDPFTISSQPRSIQNVIILGLTLLPLPDIECEWDGPLRTYATISSQPRSIQNVIILGLTLLQSQANHGQSKMS